MPTASNPTGLAAQVPAASHEDLLDIVSKDLRSIMSAIAALVGPGAQPLLMMIDTDMIITSIIGEEEDAEQIAALNLVIGGRWPLADECCSLAKEPRDASAVVIHQAVDDSNQLYGMSMATSPIFGLSGELSGYIGLIVAVATSTDILRSLAILCAKITCAQIASFDRADGLRRVVSEQFAIIDNISDGLLVVERDGRVRHMNGPAGRILGLNPEYSIGRRFGELLDFEPRLEDVFKTGEPYFDREQIVDTPTRHLHLLDTVIPIRSPKGDVEAVVNTFRQIQRARKMAHDIAGSRARYSFEDIVGSSLAMRGAIDRTRRAAMGTANILLTGESGTGKELFAQSIHSASKRSAGPFVAINCAALPRDLIESELFGYVAGSFTGAHRDGRPGKFELASSGTIFLDEVTEMPFDVQATLLRVLQEREVTRIGDTRAIPVDVRIVAASNRDLPAMVAKREFREDLYYRLNVIQIAIPSLRDRSNDIAELARHFAARYALSLGKADYRLSASVMESLGRHKWPGNVRELENAIERVVNLAEEDISFDEMRPSPGSAIIPKSPRAARSLREVERDAIRAAFEQTGDNVTQAATILGISRATLYAKVKEYGIVLGRPNRREK